MHELQKVPQGISCYDPTKVQGIFAKKEEHSNEFRLVYAWFDHPTDHGFGCYYFPHDDLFIATTNYEDVRRLIPIHIYSGWAQDKLGKDKWNTYRLYGTVYDFIPKRFWR